MPTVNLIAKTDIEPSDLISHAAKTCYSSKTPKIGKQVDVENALFKTGHHTTLQHNFFTFSINDISVATVTFGLHLTHPFYNADQRSGRYSKMYNEPDFEYMKQYIDEYWGDLSKDLKKEVLDFIKTGTDIYANSIEKGTEIALELLKKERPFCSLENLEKIAPKIAQEQLRNFISIISPTGLDYTINLSTLAAMHRVAWLPEMRGVVSQMVASVIDKFPELAYMFEEKSMSKTDWVPSINTTKSTIKTEPELKLINSDVNFDKIILHKHKDSVDLGYFSPEYMSNCLQTIKTEIEVSIATMGQDQRHRSIKRNNPVLTGSFYVPEILVELGLKNKANEFMNKYLELCKKIPETLAILIAPYGAMVKYEKLADVNALIHEQEKRTCWCAQEEIYWIAVLLRKELEKLYNKDNKLLKVLTPPCYESGKCQEGARYCGRNLKERIGGDFFPKRKV